MDITNPNLVPGDAVVWMGQGLGTIERIQRDDGVERFHVKMSRTGATLALPTARSALVLRRPMARDAAIALWNDLQTPGEPDPRTWKERYFDYMRTLVKGTVQDQAKRLQRMYGSPFKPSSGELRLITAYQDALLSELAFVLGHAVDSMSAKLRRIHPAFSTSAKPRPPEARSPEPVPDGPAVRGFDLLGSFEVAGEGLVVAGPGDHPSSADGRGTANAHVVARPGKWYGYTVEDEPTGETARLIAIHSAAGAALDELARRAVVSARVPGRAGTMAILDEAIRNEERFEDELMFGGGVGIVLGRGCASRSSRGDHPVAIVLDGAEAMYVQVDFR